MVHRDVKPDNLLLEPAEGASIGPPGPGAHGLAVKICDFGLARLAAGGVSTVTGASMGTPAYMSPDQSRGERVDGRSCVPR